MGCGAPIVISSRRCRHVPDSGGNTDLRFRRIDFAIYAIPTPGDWASGHRTSGVKPVQHEDGSGVCVTLHATGVMGNGKTRLAGMRCSAATRTGIGSAFRSQKEASWSILVPGACIIAPNKKNGSQKVPRTVPGRPMKTQIPDPTPMEPPANSPKLPPSPSSDGSTTFSQNNCAPLQMVGQAEPRMAGREAKKKMSWDKS